MTLKESFSKNLSFTNEEDEKDFENEDNIDAMPSYIKRLVKDFCTSSSDKKISQKSLSKNSSHHSSKNVTSSMKKNLQKFDKMNFDISFFNSNPKQKEQEIKAEENLNGIQIFKIKEKGLYNVKKSLRMQSIYENNELRYKNNTFECSICFRKIINYGLMSNCDDVFCYECIKLWRDEAKEKNKREMFRRCPICNKDSPFVLKSKIFLKGDEKKEKFEEHKLKSIK